MIEFKRLQGGIIDNFNEFFFRGHKRVTFSLNLDLNFRFGSFENCANKCVLFCCKNYAESFSKSFGNYIS